MLNVLLDEPFVFKDFYFFFQKRFKRQKKKRYIVNYRIKVTEILIKFIEQVVDANPPLQVMKRNPKQTIVV